MILEIEGVISDIECNDVSHADVVTLRRVQKYILTLQDKAKSKTMRTYGPDEVAKFLGKVSDAHLNLLRNEAANECAKIIDDEVINLMDNKQSPAIISLLKSVVIKMRELYL